MSGVLSGIGIDVLEIARMERALARHPRLATRVFSDAELEYARSHRRPAAQLAARFAAKEAALKALGTAEAMGLGEIEVVAGTPPTLRLAGAAARAAAQRGVALKLSITHSRETAAAVAVAEPA
jgi:holo-[acyl-carrier protein] synthase